MKKDKPSPEADALTSAAEDASRQNVIDLFNQCPIPHNALLDNLGLFLSRKALSRILFLDFLYRKIVNVHGVIMEFGVHWGQSPALYESFRGMYEPFNYNRKIIGFDTFQGLLDPSPQDGGSVHARKGNFSVSAGYESYLAALLEYHEQQSPISHIRKYQLVKGDASQTIHEYLGEHPETVIAFAYFDFDLYTPTRDCLQAIKPHLTKGSILGFDELNDVHFPGETVALREVLGLDACRIRRTTYCPLASYMVIEQATIC